MSGNNKKSAAPKRPAAAAGKRQRDEEEIEFEPEIHEGESNNGDDIQDLLGIIGQKLNKQYDTKRKKLEGFAERVVNSSNEMLAEHLAKYHTAHETRLAEFKAALAEQQREYDASAEQLRLLNQTYQQNAAVVYERLDASVANSKKIVASFWKETEEANRERKKDLVAVQKNIQRQMSNSQAQLKQASEQPHNAQKLKKGLLALMDL